MNHLPQAWGRPRDDIYGPYNHAHLQTSAPISHTQSPVVTGTSVVAAKYKDGVVIAADNLASYGSLARFTDVKRLRRFNNRIVLGFGGDVSDMQHLDRMLDSLDIRENYGLARYSSSTPAESSDDAAPTSSSEDDSVSLERQQLNAKNLHTYLQKVMYRARSEMNPLWNVILIAGLDGSDEPFLASVDLLGTTFSSPTLATGFGAHLAQPILRKRIPDEKSVAGVEREEAVELVRQAMKVLFYRDARSMDKYSIAVVEKGGKVELKQDEKLEQQSWAFAEGIRGYGTQTN